MFRASLIAILLTCAGVVFSSSDTLFEPLVIWRKNELSVCFANSSQSHLSSPSQRTFPFLYVDPSPELRKKLQATIESAYSSKRTGIHFTGWKNCVLKDEDFDSDIAVFFIAPQAELFMRNGSYLGMADIGENDRNVYDYAKRKPDGQTQSITFQSSMTGGLQTSVFLHEFGHMAGLRHEHARTESRQDPICELAGQTLFERPSKNTDSIGPYDPFSIMNYCSQFFPASHPNGEFALSKPVLDRLVKIDYTIYRPTIPYLDKSIGFTWVPGLSVRDIHTLRCLYKVYPEAERAKKCVHDYDALKEKMWHFTEAQIRNAPVSPPSPVAKPKPSASPSPSPVPKSKRGWVWPRIILL